MIAVLPEIGPDKGYHQNEKPGDGHERGAPAPPAYDQALVQQTGIEQPGNEGHRLFRIPAPEGAQGKLGIEGARDKSQGKEKEADIDAIIVQDIQHFQGRQTLIEKAEILGFKLMLLDQIDYASQKGQGKGGDAHEAGGDMKGEPETFAGSAGFRRGWAESKSRRPSDPPSG